MLKVLFGRDRTEQARTLAAVVMAAIAAVSLIQIGIDRSTSQSQASTQEAALDVARRFALALTTYDYAHPEVQEKQLEPVAYPSVVKQVTTASAEMRGLKASSIGDVIGSRLVNFGSGAASTILEVNQIVSNDLVGRGRQLSGTLDCELLTFADRAWRVTSFRWLAAPGPPALTS